MTGPCWSGSHQTGQCDSMIRASTRFLIHRLETMILSLIFLFSKHLFRMIPRRSGVFCGNQVLEPTGVSISGISAEEPSAGTSSKVWCNHFLFFETVL